MNSDKSDKRDATSSSSSSDDNSNSNESDNSTKESNRSSSNSIPPNMTEEEEKSYALVTEKFFSFSQDKNKESFQAGYRELKYIFFSGNCGRLTFVRYQGYRSCTISLSLMTCLFFYPDLQETKLNVHRKFSPIFSHILASNFRKNAITNICVSVLIRRRAYNVRIMIKCNRFKAGASTALEWFHVGRKSIWNFEYSYRF